MSPVKIIQVDTYRLLLNLATNMLRFFSLIKFRIDRLIAFLKYESENSVPTSHLSGLLCGIRVLVRKHTISFY
jgi:hypothetical protein